MNAITPPAALSRNNTIYRSKVTCVTKNRIDTKIDINDLTDSQSIKYRNQNFPSASESTII